jgi:hypothetical protein
MSKNKNLSELPFVNGIVKSTTSGFSGAVAGSDYQSPITLTTTGTSGVASFSSGVLNIPNYGDSIGAAGSAGTSGSSGSTGSSGSSGSTGSSGSSGSSGSTGSSGSSGSTGSSGTSGAGTISNGTSGYVSKFTGSTTLGNSLIRDDGTSVSIGASPNNSYLLDINGTGRFIGNLTIGNATAATNVKLILNGVASKAAGIEFHQSGTPQWYIGNGIASEDNNFELYNSNGTMAMKIIKSTNAIDFIGATSFAGVVTTNAQLAVNANIVIYGSNKQIQWDAAASSDLFISCIPGTRTIEIRNGNSGAPNYAACGLITGYATFEAAVTMKGNLNLSYSYPRINLIDTDHNSDYSIINADGNFTIYDDTNGVNRLVINSGGAATFSGNVAINNTLSSPGNLIETAGLNVYLRPASGYKTIIDTGDGLDVTSGVTRLSNLRTSTIYSEYTKNLSGAYNAGTYYEIVNSSQMASGIYIVKAYVDTYAIGGGTYFVTYVSVPFFFYTGGTNNTGSVTFPTMLGSGHANINPPTIRLRLSTGVSGGLTYLEFDPNANWSNVQGTGGATVTFYVKRIGD